MNRISSGGRLSGWVRFLMAGTALALAPAAAAAQQSQPAPEPQNSQIGPPQLRDFQLTPRERIVTQPRPAPVAAQPERAPATTTERPAQPAAERAAQRPARTEPAPRPAAPREAAPTPRAPVRAPTAQPEPAPAPSAGPAPAAPADAQVPSAPVPAAPAPEAAPVPAPGPATTADELLPPDEGGSAPAGGPPLWMILLGGLALGLIGYTLFTRRQASERRSLALAAAAPAGAASAVVPQAPRAPRPDPVPRPWLEIEFKPERTTADPEQSVVEFELAIRNNGGSTARNIQLQAKLFCSTPDQDKEIGDFHRKKPGEHRTLAVPDIPAGKELRLKGQVDVKREDIKLLRMEQRLLFVPLVAVNAFYEWGTARSGQTSKSFLVGREKPEPDDKMAPFRMDLGPRVYRTVGQRPYSLERRV